MTKRDLFRKTPRQCGRVINYLPLIAMFTLFILVFIVLIYCQTNVALSHEIGMI